MKKLLLLLLVCALLVPSVASFSEEKENLIEYKIAPIFKIAKTFNKHGIARVMDENGNIGVINTDGEKVFGFDGTMFNIRSNGLIMALDNNNMAAFFNSKGEQITDYIYDAYVTENNKTHQVNYNFLNTNDGDGESDLIRISRNKKFGYINSKGEEVIPPTYDYVYGFYKGISKTGSGGEVSPYGSCVTGKYGYIKENGETIFPPDALWTAEDFLVGDYVTITDGQFKRMDKYGNILSNINENYTIQSSGENIIIGYNEQTKNWCAFDLENNVIVPDTYKYMEAFGNTIIIDHKEVRNSKGEILHNFDENHNLSVWTDDKEFMKLSKTIGQYDKRYGYIDKDGKLIFDAIYRDIKELGEGLVFLVDEDNQRWLYDDKGNMISKLNGQIEYENCSCSLIPVLDYDTMKYGYIKNPLNSNPYLKAQREFTDNKTNYIEKTLDTPFGKIYVSHVVGAPHRSGARITFINFNGEIISLSNNVPRINMFEDATPTYMGLSSDGKFLEFQYEFSDRAKIEDMNLLLHNEGTYFYKANLETGKSYEEHFIPKTFASREEALRLIINNSSLKSKESNIKSVESFFDILYFSDERKLDAAKAIENGILFGYEGNKLNLNDNLTRAELACMIYRAKDFFNFKPIEGASYQGNYNDFADWNEKEIKFCIENGIMLGYGDSFGSNDFLTKEQVNIILERFKYGLSTKEKYSLLEICGKSSLKVSEILNSVNDANLIPSIQPVQENVTERNSSNISNKIEKLVEIVGNMDYERFSDEEYKNKILTDFKGIGFGGSSTYINIIDGEDPKYLEERMEKACTEKIKRESIVVISSLNNWYGGYFGYNKAVGIGYEYYCYKSIAENTPNGEEIGVWYKRPVEVSFTQYNTASSKYADLILKYGDKEII